MALANARLAPPGLPKLPGPIDAVIHRDLVGDLSSITLEKTATGKYVAALLCEDGLDVPELLQMVPVDAIVGVDVGLTHIAIESSGRKNANPSFVKGAQRRLRRQQTSLSRQRQGSTLAKARLTVAAAHDRVAKARGDFQHKLSRRRVDDNQAIIAEILAIKTMVKGPLLGRRNWLASPIKQENEALASTGVGGYA
jgi:putative transposase